MPVPAGERTAARKPGRPRSEEADTTILDATLHLLVETMSVDKLSMEALAVRAGVSKTTVYRRWSNKIDLIVDALRTLQPARIEDLPGTSVRADLVAALVTLQRFRDRSQAGRLFLLALAEAGRHPALYRQYFEQIVRPRREQIREILQRGVANGQVRPDADIDAVLLCLSALQTRTKLDATAMTRTLVERTVDVIMDGIAPDGATRSPGHGR